jgi:caffeoyl-CoA O-methyltransferase
MKRKDPHIRDVATWGQAQAYIDQSFASEDRSLRDAQRRAERAQLPPISISASEGRLLRVLAHAAHAKRILEVGTLGGYSAIWLARALPKGGRLVTLELWPDHADVARENIKHAGLASRVEIRVGHALPLMKKMIADREPLFDLVFIDADKDEYPGYLRLAYKLTRQGGLILADNALGRIMHTNAEQRSGVVRCNHIAAKHRGLSSVIVPVLGKGIDGLLVCVKVK